MTGPRHWTHDALRPLPSIETGRHPCEAHSPGHDLHRMLNGGGDPRSPFPSPHCAWAKFSAVHVRNLQKNIPSLRDALEGLLDLAVDSKPPAARARCGRGLDNITSKLCGKDIVSASQWLAGLRGDSIRANQKLVCNWLTFCCLHSLQAFRLPPRRLPVTGGTFSISPRSGLLCTNSPADGGRVSLGDRRSLGGIKGGPLVGANRFR